MRKLTLIAAAAIFLMASAASAATIYDNGPVSGELNAIDVTSNFEVSDSFTSAAGSVASTVDFAAWVDHGDTLQTIGWVISTGPLKQGTDLASGTSTTTSTYLMPDGLGYGYDVDNESFSVGSVALAGGTYYLTLTNAMTASGATAYWDENNGPSSASDNFNGSLANDVISNTTGSETFKISSATVSAAPEPGTWALMFGGLAMIGGMLRIANARRRENAVAGMATA